tara:strand:- start:1520 stop:1741 length:222 start_codon:yes stop_codon:yes gene_type:complete
MPDFAPEADQCPVIEELAQQRANTRWRCPMRQPTNIPAKIAIKTHAFTAMTAMQGWQLPDLLLDRASHWGESD